MTEGTTMPAERETELSALYAAADYLAECCEWAEYESVMEQIRAIIKESTHE